MRIVIDARYLTRRYSGIGIYSERLLEHLSLQDKKNEYICLVQQDYSRPLALGENFRLVRRKDPPLSLNTLFRLHTFLKKEKPDIFHSLFPLAPVFFRGKLLVTVHDLQPLMMKEWTGGRIYPVKKIYDIFYRWIYPRTFSRADWLIAVSQATKDSLTEYMSRLRDKTIVVHSGIDPEAAENPDPTIFETLKNKHDIAEKYILYIGSTRPNKNIPNMIRAFSSFLKKRPECGDMDFVLVLTADRFLADVHRVIRESGVEKNIKILDPVSQLEKHALNRNSMMLFFATMLEGFGFPLLEAQSQGTPVVASDYHALPEIAGDSALFVDPEDPEDMAEGLEKMILDQDLRKKYIARGKENIQKFSWENTARKVLEIYNHLM